jgi:hypothetical protein
MRYAAWSRFIHQSPSHMMIDVPAVSAQRHPEQIGTTIDDR